MALTLIFQIADEAYGLDIDVIQEIVEDLPIHYVPYCDRVLTGAVNFHGQVLPVIDLPVLLGFAEGHRDQRLVVYTEAEQALAFRVSKVERIVSLAAGAVQAPPSESHQSAVSGVADVDGLMLNLLDTEIVIKRLAQIISSERGE